MTAITNTLRNQKGRSEKVKPTPQKLGAKVGKGRDVFFQEGEEKKRENTSPTGGTESPTPFIDPLEL